MLLAWGRLWQGLVVYERSLPANLMEGLVDTLVAEAAEGSCEGALSRYESDIHPALLHENGVMLAELLQGAALEYHRVVGWSEGDQAGDLAYQLKADGRDVALVTLRMKEQKGVLGLALYRLEGIQGMSSVQILARPGTAVYAGGGLLDASYLTEQGVLPEDLIKLDAYEGSGLTVPRFDSYLLSGLFVLPPVTGLDEAGQTTEGVYLEEDRVLLGQHLDPQLQETLEERITTITKRYSYYMSDDLGWGGFSGYLWRNAPVYDRLRTLEVYWYTNHTSTRFENLITDRWVCLSDDLVSLRFVYDYVVVGQGKVTVYDTDLTYYLAKDDKGVWKVAEMVVN